jgi:hypothetical protein
MTVLVLPTKLVFPLYTAATGCEPTLKLEVAPLVATPLTLSVTGAPKLDPSIWNWTVPPDVPLPGAIAVTVAVSVIDCPKADGFTEDDKAVVVFA